jgi:hypothetical protein
LRLELLLTVPEESVGRTERHGPFSDNELQVRRG